MSKRCQSYHSGHDTHWIPVLRVYTDTPREPIQIVHLEGAAFEVTEIANNQKHIWHHHQPARLKSFIAKHPDAFNRVAGTTFITCELEVSAFWFNMSNTELQECPAQKAEAMNEIYLASDVLVGFNDGTTWLFTDKETTNEATPPQATTFVISACNPHSEPKDITANLHASLALEDDLKRHGFTPNLGWGQNQEGTIHELSFCIEVEPEGADATRELLTQLAREYGQNAIFEITGNEVTVLSCDPRHESLTKLKKAVKLAEPQSALKEKLEALVWLTNLTEEQWAQGQALINEKLGETNV